LSFEKEKLKSGLSARATKYSGRALFAFGHFLARKARQKWFETAFFGSTNIFKSQARQASHARGISVL